jgi:transcriptional regulator with XRE-family HTH domain
LPAGRKNRMNFSEIGVLVRQRRQTLGLSQQRLALLVDLSRATINQLETGVLVDLGVAKLTTLLNTLGLRLQTHAAQPNERGLWMASRTASVSYKVPLTASQLASALVSGELPAAIAPHISTLLDEAPLSVVVAAVEAAAAASDVPPKIIWQHVLRWAREGQSPRAAWA